MLNDEQVADALLRLKILKFFPEAPEAMMQLTRMVCRMAATEEQVEWLVDRMTCYGLYNEYPGPAEVRAVFCSRYRPTDGIEAHSTVYPYGVEIQDGKAKPLLLEAVKPERDEPVSDDPELARQIVKAAEMMQMPKPLSSARTAFTKHLEEILTPPELRPAPDPPTPQILSEEDVARAKAANEERKARGIAEYWREPEKEQVS